MKIARMMIDVDNGKMMVRVQNEEVSFNIFKAMKGQGIFFSNICHKGSHKRG